MSCVHAAHAYAQHAKALASFPLANACAEQMESEGEVCGVTGAALKAYSAALERIDGGSPEAALSAAVESPHLPVSWRLDLNTTQWRVTRITSIRQLAGLAGFGTWCHNTSACRTCTPRTPTNPGWELPAARTQLVLQAVTLAATCSLADPLKSLTPVLDACLNDDDANVLLPQFATR